MSKIPNVDKLSLDQLDELAKNVNKRKRAIKVITKTKKLKNFSYKSTPKGFRLYLYSKKEWHTLDSCSEDKIIIVNEVLNNLDYDPNLMYCGIHHIHNELGLCMRFFMKDIYGLNMDVTITNIDIILNFHTFSNSAEPNHSIKIPISDPECFKKCKVEFNKIVQAYDKLMEISKNFISMMDRLIKF